MQLPKPDIADWRHYIAIQQERQRAFGAPYFEQLNDWVKAYEKAQANKSGNWVQGR